MKRGADREHADRKTFFYKPLKVKFSRLLSATCHSAEENVQTTLMNTAYFYQNNI